MINGCESSYFRRMEAGLIEEMIERRESKLSETRISVGNDKERTASLDNRILDTNQFLEKHLMDNLLK